MDKLQISDEKLAAMQQRYSPLVLVGEFERHFYEIEACDPRTESYPWDPKVTQRVSVKRVGQFWGYFKGGASPFFKPTIAEVLAQMQHIEVPEGTSHYYVGNSDIGHVEENGVCYHTATVTLWASEETR